MYVHHITVEERKLVGGTAKKISDWFELHIINMRGKCVSKTETEAIEMSAKTAKKMNPVHRKKSLHPNRFARTFFYDLLWARQKLKRWRWRKELNLLEFLIPIISYSLFASSTSAYYIVFVHRHNVFTGIIFFPRLAFYLANVDIFLFSCR